MSELVNIYYYLSGVEFGAGEKSLLMSPGK